MGNDFFDGLSETITRTAKEFGERAEGLYETQKIRNRIAGEERLADKAKTEIGELIYQRYENGESLDNELAALCGEISRHMKKISDLKEKAAGKKGQKICPSCKKAVDKEVAFCPHCGTPCPNPEPEKEEEAEKACEEEGGSVEEECAAKEETCQECEAKSEACGSEECAAEPEEEAAAPEEGGDMEEAPEPEVNEEGKEE